ncbi:hypothetical protein [Photobacterium damselae]|uniref:hypothetical protein n=1 Tax=Photobacterium damselae TaxID=38293 RepID=UPI0040697A69
MFKNRLAIIVTILSSISAQAIAEQNDEYSLTESIQGLSFLFEKLPAGSDIDSSKYQMTKHMTPNGYEYLFTPMETDSSISSGDDIEYVNLGVGKASNLDNAMERCSKLTLKDKKWRLISDLDMDNLIISHSSDVANIIVPSQTSNLIWLNSNLQDVFSSDHMVNTGMVFLKQNELSYNGFYSKMVSDLSTICVSF